MNKEDLREQFKAARLAMPAIEVEAKSAVIIEKLIKQIDWPNIASLHTYVPIPKLNEVSTWPLLKFAWQNYPQIITAIPTARRPGKHQSIIVNAATRWRGLLPGSRIPTPPDFKFDVIIVPTLAFDKNLNRLGWGGGWYDKFLASQPQAFKIGLCFEDFKATKIPAEPHDIPLDVVIT